MGRHPTILYCIHLALISIFHFRYTQNQGGRSWQPFGKGKNGHKNFHQASIYYFCVKCVFFVRKCKLANLIQCNMRYIQCNSALLAKEALFLTKKGTCFVQSTGSPPHQKWTAS